MFHPKHTVDSVVKDIVDTFTTPQDPNREILKAIHDLESLSEVPHAARTIGILLGRLYRQVDGLDEAISALDRSLTIRRNASIPEDEDDGNLYYNRACYKVLKARIEKNEQKQNLLEHEALDDLTRAIRLSPENGAVAKMDPDLKEITNHIGHLEGIVMGKAETETAAQTRDKQKT
jgi:tetratricopeptide (TPR) repeat protein